MSDHIDINLYTQGPHSCVVQIWYVFDTYLCMFCMLNVLEVCLVTQV